MKKVLLALAAVLAFGLIPATSASADNPSDEASFVTLINGLRATKGLRALEIDAGLTSKARAWAQTMSDQNRIWHSTLSDGITADWARLGENVGMGGTVDLLHVAFVNSPKHYDNLVDPSFRLIGIGIVRDAAGKIFVAEEFMLLQAPVAATVAPVVAAPAVQVGPAVPAPPAPPVKAPTTTRAPVAVVKATPVAVAAPQPASPPAAPAETVRATRVPMGGSAGSQRWASAL